jgi:hypothetical protein
MRGTQRRLQQTMKVLWLHPSQNEWLLVNPERTIVHCRVAVADTRSIIYWERPARMQGPFASPADAKRAAEGRLGVTDVEEAY